MKKQNKIKLGISGGALREPLEEIFNKAGWKLLVNRKLSTIYIDDPEIECFFARAKEIAPLISRGVLDSGIVSRVAIAETKVNLKIVDDLGTADPAWSQTRLVLAVPENSSIKSLRQLAGKKIITRVPEITKEFLRKHKISSLIEFSDETNESRVPAFADALVEFTNTGATLRNFRLKVLEVVMKDSVVLAANPESLKSKWKNEKIENLGLLLKGARLGQEMVGLMLHASNDMLEEVFLVLPALKKPTVTHLRGENWFDVFTVIKEKEARKLIPLLKKIGCTDIIELPLNKVVI